MQRSWTPALLLISTVLIAHFLFWAWRSTEVFHPPRTFEKWFHALVEFFPAMLLMGAGYAAIWWRYSDRRRG
jgi:hypothetical protein